MTHLDQMIADALAQSPDTVVHHLASEVVRLRAAIGDALRPLYEGGHIYAKPLEDAIRKPAENLFHKNCRSCICWNGDMCELISHICENGEQWLPSADFVAAHPEVAALVDFAEQMRASASQFSAALDAVQKEIADLKRGGVAVPIPADRELMRLVDELIRWHGLRPLDKRPDHAAALVGAIKALRAQPTQEPAP